MRGFAFSGAVPWWGPEAGSGALDEGSPSPPSPRMYGKGCPQVPVGVAASPGAHPARLYKLQKFALWKAGVRAAVGAGINNRPSGGGG